MTQKLMNKGRMNYMSLHGKYLYARLCQKQSKYEPCKRSCEQTFQFFKDALPKTIRGCTQLKKKSLVNECRKVVYGRVNFTYPLD